MKKFAIIGFLIFFNLSSSFVLAQNLKVGADRLDVLLPLLENKRVAIVANQTSLLSDGTHLLDTLLSRKVNVRKVFAPEHGFRGDADAGALIVDGKDSKTGIQVVSLYGKNYKPSVKQLSDVDIVIFDIQDVGTRFYTYISTMHYVMDACSQNVKDMIVLDRPNPNDYIDGPVLKKQYESFVGMHPIPVLHGLTVGELAQMINGEDWLPYKRHCKLTVIPIDGWVHGQPYSLPVQPSPNLPNDQAIKLYPSLCFFEATAISVGRGTSAPFQVVGGHSINYGKFTFTPRPREGAMNPLLAGIKCYGVDLRNFSFPGGLSLTFLIDFYNRSNEGTKFFTNPRFMDLLSGTDELRKQIVAGKSEGEIRKTWVEDLDLYMQTRSKYLLYKDYAKSVEEILAEEDI